MNAEKTGRLAQTPSWSPLANEILDVIAGLRFGSVEITVHDGKVVQVEKREKIRFENRKNEKK
jgi:hypothetical protein